MSKERVSKEYFRRIRKIWKSELYSRNKVTAHNIFAVPVLVPTFGILDWTKKELEDIDIKTRKILTQCGCFHRNSNVDRLYSPTEEGGRGLSNISDTFISRIASLAEHLRKQNTKHKYLTEVFQHESIRTMR